MAASLSTSSPSASAAPATAPAGSEFGGLKIGVATYSLRTLSIDAAIKAIQRVGLHYASLKDMHLPFKATAEERREIVQKFTDGGITVMSCGVVTLPKDEAGCRKAFEYARCRDSDHRLPSRCRLDGALGQAGEGV